MKNFEIKITGSGTIEEIIESLRCLAANINPLDVCGYEDSTLYMDISEQEEEFEDE